MTGRTLRFFETETFELEPETPAFVVVCESEPCWPGSRILTHYRCDPVTCPEAAWEAVEEARVLAASEC